MTEAEQQAVSDIRDKMIRDNPLRVVEAVDDAMPAFEQESHTLMLAAIDKVAIGWVNELKRIREQTVALEAMVIAQCDRTKSEITKMHMLGVQTLREADRTQEVNRSIAAELDRMMQVA
jgi:hypothetical protein